MKQIYLDHAATTPLDRKVLETIIFQYAGGPVGVETLAATIGEEVETIEDVYEPYLMQLGFIQRTPRGRTVTRLGYAHFGIPYDEPKENPFEQISLHFHLLIP